MNSISNRNISFSSRNCPIKPQIFHSKNGDILIREALTEELEAADRFAWNTAIEVHEDYAHYRDPANLDEKEAMLKKGLGNIKKRLADNDGNTSYLVARDSNSNIVGTAEMKDQELFPCAGDLFSLYVAPHMRYSGLGTKMSTLLIDSVRGFYSDIFVGAGIESVDFYKKLGFGFAPKTHGSTRSKAIDMLERHRDDVIVGEMNLDPQNPVEKRYNLNPYIEIKK